MQIEIDRRTEKLLEKLGAKDEEAKTALAQQRLLEALEDETAGQEGRAAMEQRFGDEIRKGLESGPGREWRDEDWQALMRGEYKHTPEEDSWAVPPDRRKDARSSDDTRVTPPPAPTPS